FEFDLVDSDTGITPGNVRVPFDLQATEPGSELIDPITQLPIPGTGRVRPQTASEVAAAIVAAINRSDVQSLLDVPAQLDSGAEEGTSARINLFSDIQIGNASGALASVGRGDLRGDDNRDRDAQGVILVENSVFSFNQNYGIVIDHDETAVVGTRETNSVVRYPRNLVELNTENLVPGVVVQSNVIAYNLAGGLQINGFDTANTDTLANPVAYDRIVNNTIVGGTIAETVGAPPQTIDGVLFPQGSISFADAVVSYVPDAGGPAPAAIFQNAENALGQPDVLGRGDEPTDGTGTVSIGDGGELTLQFTDNLLTGSGDSTPDLVIFERGAIETVAVSVSRDGINFLNVGTAGGASNTVDLDAFGFGTQDQFAFVRLRDIRQNPDAGNGSIGADIDAVGAISTVTIEDFESGGVGVEVTGNAAPSILNNVIANTEQGIDVAGDTGVVLGANSFYQNESNLPDGVALGQFSQELSDAEVLFVNASRLVFTPASGASVIDSSIDSLPDRFSLTTVKNPLGVPPSPIIAPSFDVNGQLRIDDPNVETPSGLGERVFKDRGASDRGDITGPRAVLTSPLAEELGIAAGAVSVFGQAPEFFELQLVDGLAPADVTPGTGIDDASISSSSVLFLKDNEFLVEGIDYRFGYNPSTNVIRLTPIAGVFEQDSTYVIRLVDQNDAIIQAVDGVQYTDGTILNIRDINGDITRVEYETGLQFTVPVGTLDRDADGSLVTIFDGVNEVTFELDNNSAVIGDNVPVNIPLAGFDEDITSALVAAINANTMLNVTAVGNERTLQIIGDNPLATVETDIANVSGAIGTEIGFGLQLPNEGADLADSLADGQSFTIQRANFASVTFEFSDDGELENDDAIAIPFNAQSTLDSLADEMVRVIGGEGLGLAPTNRGFGRIELGGDANYAIDLNDTTLELIGLPGQRETVPVDIRIDQTADEIAQLIADAIEAAGIAGVTLDTADSRVFLEGSQGVDGVGAVESIIVQDEVGNLLQSNQPDGGTELTIFIGGGFDYGDAPASYGTRNVDDGPRHPIAPGFSIGPTVTPDADAVLPNADIDDGLISFNGRAGFVADLGVRIQNDSAEAFVLDIWFDWNQDGVFDSNENFTRSFTSPAISGDYPLTINVPGDAVPGQTFARMRLTRDGVTAPTGLGGVGEVEDFIVTIEANPFQNPNRNLAPTIDQRLDVNDSGTISPLDALLIINAINAFPGVQIDLNTTVPSFLPLYPDVDGNGIVSAGDALQIINHIISSSDNIVGGESEMIESANATGYVNRGGVLVSGATALGDELIAEGEAVSTSETSSTPSEKTSVFDDAASIGLDPIVDILAEDTAEANAEGEGDSAVHDKVMSAFC
ncbi:MAG: GEVED domain-containing protein, partial [Planctomycetota bacterium]